MIMVMDAGGNEYRCADQRTADKVIAETGGHIVAMPDNTLTLDDTLTAEIDALAETYYRWAVTEDSNPLAGICNDLYRALLAVLAQSAPEGTQYPEGFADRVLNVFSDCRPDRSLSSAREYVVAELAEYAAWEAARELAKHGLRAPIGWDKV